MIIYLAGNFPMMCVPKEERKFKKVIEKHDDRGHFRLVSFFFSKETANLLAIKKGEEHGNR